MVNIAKLFMLEFLVIVLLASGLKANNNDEILEKTDYFIVPELLLSCYVQHPSVTGFEKEAGEYFAYVSEKLGLHTRVFTDEINSYNFAASLYPLSSGKPNIIFLNHIDVVPAEDHAQWTYPPFSGEIADGMVWGRGAIDNKGMGVMQLLSIAAFVDIANEVDLPYNVTLLSVSHEEKGGSLGASIVVENFLEELNPLVVYGEGGTGVTGISQRDKNYPFFGISISQKRGLWFSLEASNPSSGHGSMPRKRYPNKDVVLASQALLNRKQEVIITEPVRLMMKSLGKHERGSRGLALRNIRLFAPMISKTLHSDLFISALVSNTITLTNIASTPGADNQVASEARAVFDSRLLPTTDTDKFLADIQKRIKDYNVTLNIINESVNAPDSEIGEYYFALEDAIKKVFGDVGVTPILFLAFNDNAYFRLHGVPAYGMLPAVLSDEVMESIHNVDERIAVKSLYDGITVYNELLKILLELDEDFVPEINQYAVSE